MNVAIAVTVLRLVLLPIIIYLIYQNQAFSSLLAVILFSLIILSDVFDGYIARRRHEITRFGSFLDPVSDKLIIYSLVLIFAIKEQLLLIMLILFMVRDIIVNYCRFIAAKHDFPIKEYAYTKIKAAFQYALVLFLLSKEFFNYGSFQDSFFLAASQGLIWLLVLSLGILSVTSSIYYGVKVWRQVRRQVKLGKEVENGSLVILANKKSRGYRDLYRRRLLNVFSRRRKAKMIYLSMKQEEMYQGIAQQIKDSSQIVIAGGDGSFESALNYQPFWKKSLGFFPLGAGNAFYSYFYKGKRFEYLRSRFKFRVMELDVLELEWEKGSRQTLFAGIGVDAEIPRLTKKRTQNGFFDYIAASWRGLLRGKADYDLSLKINGKNYSWDNCINITFGKVPYYGYSIRSFPGQIVPNDGLVYGLACVSPHSLVWNKPLRLWGLLLTMFGINRPPMLDFKSKEIMIKSEVPFPVQAGGEFIGYSSWVKVRVVRQQKVLVI